MEKRTTRSCLVAENPAAQLELWEAEAAAWEAASRATALVEGGTDDPTQAAHAARDASAAWLAAAEATEKAAGQ